MRKVKTKRFEVADHLDDPELIAAYLNDALTSGNSAEIALALGHIAKAKGMTKVAAETGLGRESLYKSLGGETQVAFDTVQKIVNSFGLAFAVKPKSDDQDAA